MGFLVKIASSADSGEEGDSALKEVSSSVGALSSIEIKVGSMESHLVSIISNYKYIMIKSFNYLD